MIQYALLMLLFGQLTISTESIERKSKLRLVKTVALPGTPGRIDHFGFDARSGRLFVSNQGNTSLDVLDAKTGELLKQVPDQKRIHGIALDPKTGRIFVGNGDPGECAVIDGKSYEVLARLPVPKANQIQFDPHSGYIFVGHLDLTAIDPANMKIVKVLTTPGDLKAFRIDPTQPRLYANSVTDEICVFDTKELKLQKSYQLKAATANAAMAIDATNRRLFVGCRGDEDTVLVLNMDDGVEITRVAIPPGVDDMWYDPAKKLILSSTAGGELVVISQTDADKYSRIEGIAVSEQARTCYFDSTASRLYLGVPGDVGSNKASQIEIYEVSP